MNEPLPTLVLRVVGRGDVDSDLDGTHREWGVRASGLPQ